MGKYATAATVSFSNQLAALATTFHTLMQKDRAVCCQCWKSRDPNSQRWWSGLAVLVLDLEQTPTGSLERQRSQTPDEKLHILHQKVLSLSISKCLINVAKRLQARTWRPQSQRKLFSFSRKNMSCKHNVLVAPNILHHFAHSYALKHPSIVLWVSIYYLVSINFCSEPRPSNCRSKHQTSAVVYLLTETTAWGQRKSL